MQSWDFWSVKSQVENNVKTGFKSSGKKDVLFCFEQKLLPSTFFVFAVTMVKTVKTFVHPFLISIIIFKM